MGDFDKNEDDMFSSSGIPIDLSEIAEGDPFDDDMEPFPLDKVNSYTADPTEEPRQRGMAGVFNGKQFQVARVLGKHDMKACYNGEIKKAPLERLEINLDAPKESYAAKLGKASFAEKEKVGAAPATPFLLMKTHFYCIHNNLNSVVNGVDAELKKIPQIACEFDKKKCSWSAICVELEGSALCHMTVNIYKAKKSSSSGSGGEESTSPYIVECNRLNGEHSVFRRVFGLLSKELSNSYVDSNLDVTDTANPNLLRHSSGAFEEADSGSSAVRNDDVSSEDHTNGEEVKNAVYAIAAWAYESRQETRLLSARLLADFSANMFQSGNEPLCTSKQILGALLHLAKSTPKLLELRGEDEVRYCAFLALSNLSKGTVVTKNALIDAGIVPVIIDAIKNGSYKDAHIRRLCASMLHGLSEGFSLAMAKRILYVLGAEKVNQLFPVIDGLEDECMLNHANMAKQNLVGAKELIDASVSAR